MHAHCNPFSILFFSIKNANPIYRIYRTCQLKMEIDLRRRKIFLHLSSLRESSILEKDSWWFFSTPSTRIREGCQDWNFQSTLFSFHRLTKPFNVGAYFTRQSSSWKKKKSRDCEPRNCQRITTSYLCTKWPAPWHQTGIKLGYYRWTIEPSPIILLTRLLDSAWWQITQERE